MSIGTIVVTGKHTTVMEVVAGGKEGSIHLSVRNAQGGIILEDASIIVGIDTLVNTINNALDGTGNHITLWKEA